MAKKIADKTILLNDSREKILKLLKDWRIVEEFMGVKIYIFTPEYIEFFQKIDNDLSIYRDSNTKRGKAYSIDKIVNILNIDKVAYNYKFVKAEKYVFISTKERSIKEADKRVAISAHIYDKEIENLISNNDFSSDYVEKIIRENEKKKIKEREDVNKIMDNPDICEKVYICGFKDKIEYGQVNYGYYKFCDKKKEIIKARDNKHLSIKYPNILFYNPEEVDDFRSDMKAAYLISEGYVEITRNVFVKYQKDSHE